MIYLDAYETGDTKWAYWAAAIGIWSGIDWWFDSLVLSATWETVSEEALALKSSVWEGTDENAEPGNIILARC